MYHFIPHRYNRAHIDSRTLVENAFGSWKGRFGILLIKMRHAPKKCGEIIVVTGCIHNFAISLGDMWLDAEGVHHEDHDPRDNYNIVGDGTRALVDGKLARRNIVRNYFA